MSGTSEDAPSFWNRSINETDTFAGWLVGWFIVTLDRYVRGRKLESTISSILFISEIPYI